MLKAFAAAALAAVLAACTAPVPTRPGAGGSPSPAFPSPAGSASLAQADEHFFSGRYTDAEREYRDLAGQGDAHAKAHLAILLAYESRFHESVQQARAAVAAISDSANLARLTRALDWSGETPAAVAAGQKAVAAQPVDPIAHDYLAEAYADAGRYAESRDQLAQAQKQALTVYQRAEVDREWSNYYRDRGQTTDELNYVNIARQAEPGFPERVFELAREYYGAKPSRVSDARAQLAAGLKGHDGEYPLFVEAGDSALAGNDRTTAESYYHQALAASPGGEAATLGLSQIYVAIKRDPGTAHSLLVTALKAHPDSSAVYQYLFYLDQLVLKKDPLSEIKPIAASAPPGLAQERKSAYDTVDAYRRNTSEGPLHTDTALEKAAQAHAYYVLFNFNNPALDGLGIHAEVSSLPGFTGANSAERDRVFGYRGYQGSEVINHTFTAEAAVEVWVDSVYHRYPLTGRETVDFGFGEASVSTYSVNVMDVGIGPPQTSQPILYPARNQAGIPPGFTGNELPDPAPNANYPIGYPVTVQVGAANTLALTSAVIAGADGKPLPLYVLPPGGQDVANNELAVMPRSPLKPSTTYTVTIVGRLDGRPWSISWKFTTTA